jgi:hypothetical protein
MRRFAFVALAALAMLTGCGGSGSGTPSSQPSGSAAPATYRSPPPSLPASAVELSTAKPPWPAPATLASGDPQGVYPTAAGLPYAEEMLSVHYHAHLDVIADGAQVAVPAGIGFVGTPPNHYRALAPLHTHQQDGVIHIENSVPATFVLGQFFIEWGVRLTGQCVGGLCAGNGKELAFFIDGQRFTGDPASIVLKKHEEIAIEYGDAGKLPPPPASYSFANGL